MYLIDLDKIDWTTFPADFLSSFADAESVFKWLRNMPKVTAFALTDSQNPATQKLGEETKAALSIFIKKYLDCCCESVKERSDKK